MLTELIVRFAAEHRYVPEAIMHDAKRSILNGIAAAIGAVDSEPVRILIDWARATAAPGPGQVWGWGDAFTPSAAALINGTMSHVLDFDDTHPWTLLHPTSPTLPSSLQPAEASGTDGRVMLEAFAIGAEVSLRLGSAVFPAHYERGYHITATAGAIGAAAAAARVLRLSDRQIHHAVGIAAALSSGLRATFGSDCKAFQVGHAARNGIVAAELAARGLTGPAEPLEGPVGWARAGAGGFDVGQLDGLGETWRLAGNTYKAFACGLVAQATVDGVIRLRDRHGIRPEEVRAIELVVAPRALDLCGNPAPRRGLEGKFSVHHAAAAALVDGKGGEAQFTDARVQDLTVAALRGKVSAVTDPALADDQARVAISLADGRRPEILVEHCVGSSEYPMTDAMLEEKFRSLDLRLGVLAAVDGGCPGARPRATSASLGRRSSGTSHGRGPHPRDARRGDLGCADGDHAGRCPRLLHPLRLPAPAQHP